MVAKGQTIGTTTYTDSDATTGTVIPKAVHTVKFELNGGTPAQADQKVIDGEKIVEPSVTKDGFILDGWYKEATFTNKWDFAKDTVTADITLYAKWKADSKAMVTVTASNATIVGADIVVPSGIYTNDALFKGVFVKNRTVTLSPYEVGKYEVTYELWKEVYDWAVNHEYIFSEHIDKVKNGVYYNSAYGSPEFAHSLDDMAQPVCAVYWCDAIIWCNAYTEMINGNTNECVYKVAGAIAKDAKTKLPPDESSWVWPVIKNVVCDISKKGFRLPTEAEWEYAARGANFDVNSKYAGTDDFAQLTDYAWYAENCSTEVEGTMYENSTHPVGYKTANRLGIHDMSGNVSEWCFDWMPESWSTAIETGTFVNPLGPSTGKHDRVMRGGSFATNSKNSDESQDLDSELLVHIRSAKHYYEEAYCTIGFRVARTK